MSVIILRPKEKVTRTANALQQAGLPGVCVALMQTSAVDPLPEIEDGTKVSHIIITSTAAARIAAQQYLAVLKRHTCISIGPGTAAALLEFGVDSCIPDKSDSEGLLALETLQSPSSMHPHRNKVLIFKGERGRDLLSPMLLERGFKPTELNVYRRVPLSEPLSSAYWQPKHMQYMVATSGEQVMLAFQQFEPHWLKTLTWITVSERTAEIAKNYGVQQLAVSNGASDNALITTLKTLMER